MIKFLVTFLILLGSVNASTFVDGKLELSGDDFFGIVTPFDENLSEDFSRKLMTYQGDKLFIYINSPGGEIFAMLDMIAKMKASPIKFICVARLAASAAFMTFQHCHERHLLREGVLMSHNAGTSIQGELPRIRTRLEMLEALVTPVEIVVAKRLQMSMARYKVLINSNLWITHQNAKELNSIDDFVTVVTCSKETIEATTTKLITERTILGSINRTVKLSNCPLLTKELQNEE
jgi:ATP-dependent protease ClpP protease subunit